MSSTKQTAPYGAWKSPITSELIVSQSLGLGQCWLDGDDIYWGEGRPAEKGRVAIMRRSAGGETQELTPAPFNARTRVHEYGGGAYCAHDGVVYFSNFADNRLYRVRKGEQPEAITPTNALRYADMYFDPGRKRLVCILEDHSRAGHEAANSLAAVALDGSGEVQVLASGYDFYASPRLSPDGKSLAWLSWNHHNMPWDGCELWVAKIDPNGGLEPAVKVAGGASESIFQPEWSPAGSLYFLSDRSGWWNFYHWHAGTREEHPTLEMEAEFGLPQWVFGMSTYGFVDAGLILCSYTQAGGDFLALLDTKTGQLENLETPYSEFFGLKVSGARAVMVAGSAVEPAAVCALDVMKRSFSVLQRSTTVKVDKGYLSVPQAIEFPTENGLTAHAIYYPPVNKDFSAPAGELPPLLVFSHGGPTSATGSSFSLGLQFWTSRGFAVVDVNYGGSTGYGRPYRERLKDNWGIVDVQDCTNAALYLAEQGLADRQRLAIRGGSAGGYTTLCGLAFTEVFKAGASHFGVGDLEALALDTHKFESRYLDGLVGAYPEKRQIYLDRSPVHHIDKLNCPVIFFQGLDDKVVPPNQAEAMVTALKAKGIPVAYLAYEGEGHGFRQAQNIQRSLEAELYFYGKVFGFEPAEAIEPVEIYNL